VKESHGSKGKKNPDPLSAIELGKFHDAIMCEWNAECRNQGLAEISKETRINLRGVRQILWRWLERNMPADEAWPALGHVDMVQGYKPIYDNEDGRQKGILSPLFEAQAQRNLNDMRFRWRANAILAEAFLDGTLQPMLSSRVVNVPDSPCPQWVWLDARRGLRLAGSGSLGGDMFGEGILEIDARHTLTTREKYHKQASIRLERKSWCHWFETQFPEYVKRWPLSYESQEIVLTKQAALSDKGPDIETGSPLPDVAFVSLCEAVTWAATGYCRDESCMSDSLYADYSAISELTEHFEDKTGCPFDNVFLKILNVAIEGRLEMWGRDGDDSYYAMRSNNSLTRIDIALLMNYANQHWWENVVFFGGGVGNNSSCCDVKVQRAPLLALFPERVSVVSQPLMNVGVTAETAATWVAKIPPEKTWLSLIEAASWVAFGHSFETYSDWFSIPYGPAYTEAEKKLPIDEHPLIVGLTDAVDKILYRAGNDSLPMMWAMDRGSELLQVTREDLAIERRWPAFMDDCLGIYNGLTLRNARYDVKVARFELMVLFPESPATTNTASNQALQTTISPVSDADLKVWIDTRRNNCEPMGVKATYNAAKLHFDPLGKSVTRARVSDAIGSKSTQKGRPKK
jgi:hypothetical protein